MALRAQITGITLMLVVPRAATAASGDSLDLTGHWAGYLTLAVFALAYALVIAEENLQLRKSKPMLVAAGAIWALVAIAYANYGQPDYVAEALRRNLLEFAELMLFLLAAMTYVNTLEERNVFKALRAWLISKGFSLRSVFWLTGLLAFFISPFIDNLTTALVMGAVVLAVGAGFNRFIAVACINIVVAANAGGAFSPFGDITTLMVWQKGVVRFEEFLALFVPSLVNWLLPAALMSLAVPQGLPSGTREAIRIKPGGLVVIALFLLTIALTVLLHHLLLLPPFLGMMTGLGILKFYGYFIRRSELQQWSPVPELEVEAFNIRNSNPSVTKPFVVFTRLKRAIPKLYGRFIRGRELELPQQSPLPDRAFNLRDYYKPALKPFDIFISMKRVEWDTLMFFYGVVLCVGGLGSLGYLALLSETLYTGLGATLANVLIGLVSAVIDNIPLMFAVLSMNPDMVQGQWLLVTLTTGVGGSLFSIGSAAGVALMGQARNVYTFFSHFKWSWAIALGYAASIGVHLLVNASLFE